MATPSIDTIIRVTAESLPQMGLHGRNLAKGLQALESFTVGFLAREFVGHPHHLDNRLGRRRMVGVPDFTANAQTTDDIAAINKAPFWMSAHAVLDTCAVLAQGSNAD